MYIIRVRFIKRDSHFGSRHFAVLSLVIRTKPTMYYLSFSDTIYKTHRIAGFAKSVIFNIGRFSYDQKRKETVKINTRITLPLIIDIELFDDNSRESYATESVSLTGVIVHTGRSAQSGHYIAALKNPSGVWYYYDDDITQSIEIDEFLQTHNRNIYFAAYTHNSSCS